MKTYSYSKACSDFSSVFDTALNEEVVVKKSNGIMFRIISYNEKKSPFDAIKGLKTGVPNNEIVDIIKDARASY
ncbi:hypothetical protein AGMMS4957_21340 [Bacteroidia bacterium]|nr:hypothetical protein AGMMS4957_21340 [Bacteroidia bacterium]